MRRAAMIVDVAAVTAFVLIGRASHDHAETAAGFLSTAWPFATGLAVGWLAAAVRPQASWREGILACLATVGIGMVLRVLAGQGTAPAFVVVALVFLGAAMIGGRIVFLRRPVPGGAS